MCVGFVFFFSSRRRHTRYWRDWSSDVCSSDLLRRPRGENQQLGGLQAGSEFVQLHVPRRYSGDALPFLEDSFQALEIVADDVLNRKQPHPNAVFRQCENRRLRAIQNGVRAILALKRALLNIVSSVNQ